MNDYTFYYEDFVTDISNYLKQRENDYLVRSFDGLSTQVDKNKLALCLSDFWLNITE